MKHRLKALAKNGKPESKISRYSRYKYKRKGFQRNHRQKWIVITSLIYLAFLTFCSFYYTDNLDLARRSLNDCEEEEVVETESDGGSSFLFEEVFSMEQLKSGAIMLHVLGILYTFLGLAIICDCYFEPALSALCEHLELTEDVAGATFMAAGGSAPELATSVIGVFFAKNDIGFGTIVGSAVFNVLFVIAICCIVAPGLHLNWWPLCRDCIFYCLSILLLSICVINNQINVWESFGLFAMYFVYVLIMKYNEQLFDFVHRQMNIEIDSGWRLQIRSLVETMSFKLIMLVVIILNFTFTMIDFFAEATDFMNAFNASCAAIYIVEYVLKCVAYGFFSYWTDTWNAVDGALVFLIFVEFAVSSTSKTGGMRAFRLIRFFRFIRSMRVVRVLEISHVISLDKAVQTREKNFLEPYIGFEEAREKYKYKPGMIQVVRTYRMHGKSHRTNKNAIVPDPSPFDDVDASDEEIHALLRPDQGSAHPRKTRMSSLGVGIAAAQAVEDDGSDDDDEGPPELFDMGETLGDYIWWAVNFPLIFMFHFTIPDTSKPHLSKYYLLSFFICVIWIGILSYFMVFMATTLGKVLNIPDPVMGLTLLAGGTSIPDLLSSAAVAQRGYGDMAVSSSIGSNIFDILVGLPVPWLLYTGMVHPGSKVEIASDGLMIMVMSLLLMVGFVCLLIHFYGWTLNKNLAYTFVALYILFVGLCLGVEYGLFLQTSC